MPDKIHLTVATVIENAGKFLMVRERDNGLEVINQPAGHVEPGETLQQAALRETLEETGWRVELTGLLGLSHYTSPNNGKTYYRVSFTAKVLEEAEEYPLDDDILSAEWLTVEQLECAENLRSPLVLSDISKYIRKEVYTIDFITNIEPIKD